MYSLQTDDLYLYLGIPGWREIIPGKVFYWTSPWAPTPPAIEAGVWDRNDLSDIPGHWALVDLRGPHPSLTVDRQRSRPLVAGKHKGRWLIADNIEDLRSKMPFHRNRKAARLFRHFGHTIGMETLVRNIWDTPAASTLTLNQTPQVQPYLTYRAIEDPVTSQEAYSANYEAAMDAAMGRLLEQVGDRQLVVPISAGLDSRLILTWLRRLGATNVVAYSYGLEEAPERAMSQAVAEALGYPFEFQAYDADQIRAAWTPKQAKDYTRLAWGGTSLPHKQDWYAIHQLVDRGVIKPGAVVLPGHTVPGAPAGPDVFTRHPNMELVAADIAATNGHQQQQPERAAKDPLLLETMDHYGKQVDFGAGTRDNLTLWQWTALQERQAKFITNSVRIYEHFDLDWALPLHEPEIWEARQSGSDELTYARAGYRTFVEEAFDSVAKQPLAELLETQSPKQVDTTPTTTAPPKGQRRGLLTMLKRSNLGMRLYRLKNPILSPWGMEAFRPERSPWQVLFRRGPEPTGNGISSDALLSGTALGTEGLFD